MILHTQPDKITVEAFINEAVMGAVKAMAHVTLQARWDDDDHVLGFRCVDLNQQLIRGMEPPMLYCGLIEDVRFFYIDDIRNHAGDATRRQMIAFRQSTRSHIVEKGRSKDTGWMVKGSGGVWTFDLASGRIMKWIGERDERTRPPDHRR